MKKTLIILFIVPTILSAQRWRWIEVGDSATLWGTTYETPLATESYVENRLQERSDSSWNSDSTRQYLIDSSYIQRPEFEDSLESKIGWVDTNNTIATKNDLNSFTPEIDTVNQIATKYDVDTLTASVYDSIGDLRSDLNLKASQQALEDTAAAIRSDFPPAGAVFSDFDFAIQNASDATKVFNFDNSDIPTATTRTMNSENLFQLNNTTTSTASQITVNNDFDIIGDFEVTNGDVRVSTNPAGLMLVFSPSSSNMFSYDAVTGEFRVDYNNLPFFSQVVLQEEAFFQYGSNQNYESRVIFDTNNIFLGRRNPDVDTTYVLIEDDSTTVNGKFVVKDGITFADGTTQTTAATGGGSGIEYYERTRIFTDFTGEINLNFGRTTYPTDTIKEETTATYVFDSAVNGNTVVHNLIAQGFEYNKGNAIEIGLDWDTTTLTEHFIIYEYQEDKVFRNIFYTEIVDTSAPVLLSAEIGMLSDSIVVAFFDEPVFYTDTTGITIDTFGTKLDIIGLTGNGTAQVGFALPGILESSDTLKISYNGLGNFENLKNIPLNAFADSSVENNIVTNIPTDQLLAGWPLRGDTDDISGNGLDATNNGATLTETDRFGNANNSYLFDGVNDYMTAPGSTLALGLSDRSISLWLKCSSTSSSGQLGGVTGNDGVGGGAQDGYSMQVSANSSNGIIRTPAAQDLANVGDLNADTDWKHFVCTWDRDGNMSVYLNGVFVTSTDITAYSAVDIDYNKPFTFAARDGNSPDNFFDGAISDVYVYGKVLTQSEITQLYEATE